MREASCLGTSGFATVTLLAFIACAPFHAAHASLPASELRPAAGASRPAAKTAPNPDGAPAVAEPVTELPVMQAPQIEAINLFPNQGEIASGNGFNDQRFGYVLHGEVRAAYESNLFIQPQNEQEDFIFTVSPGVAVGWGEFKSKLFGSNSFRHRFERFVGRNYFYVDYSPSYTWYANREDLDAFDQAARLEAEFSVQRLTFGLHANYVTQTAPLEDIGNRVRQRQLTAALISRYDYSGKSSVEVNGYYDGLGYDRNGVDSREWRNEDWLNYRISPNVKLGVGGTVAQVERDLGATQHYEQAQLRGICEVSEKLAMSLTAGAEWRQTEGGDDREDGIFAFDLAWNPFSGTSLYVKGYRRSITASTDASDYFVATGAVAQCRQRLFQRCYVDLTVQYQNADYQDPANSPGFGRSDDLFIIRPGVGFDLASWVNCEITGEYRRNESSDEQRAFDATTAMVRFNLSF